MNTNDRQPGIESRLVDILASRGKHAIEMESFKAAANATDITTKAFWQAILRLEEKGRIFRWKTERFEEYFVLAEHRADAYYLEAQQFQCSIFEDPIITTVRRSPPFVSLGDDDHRGETAVSKRNRYRELAVA